VIDDFVPQGDDRTVSTQHSSMEWVLRAVGNHQGRQRLNADGTPQPDRPPRGLIISTGEDRCRGESADARSLSIPFVREDVTRGVVGTIDKAVLSELQTNADAGLFAGATAAYLAWLAPRLDGIRSSLADRVREKRALASRNGDHGRTPEIVADLHVGIEQFLDFAIEVGAIDHNKRVEISTLAWDGLMEAAAEMRADRSEASDSGDQFIQLVVAGLQSGDGYLVNRSSEDEPRGMESVCGWMREQNNYGQPRWRTWPNASRVGWVDSEFVYLAPDSSYALARKMANKQGSPLAASKRSIAKNLFDTKRLSLVDPGKADGGASRYSHRIYAHAEDGKKRQVSVLPIACNLLWPDPDQDQQQVAETIEGII
jgi:hypothetical protein